MGFGPALAWLKALCVLGLSTGRICAQPETDPITSGLLNMDPPPTRRRQRFGWLDVEVFRSVSGRARIVRIAPDFCQNLLIFAGSDWISKKAWLISTSLGRSRRDPARSQRDQARSRRDPARPRRDQASSRRDLAGSRQIGQNRTGELLQSTEKAFPLCFPVGSVEIGFPCFNPSTDPPDSDFGSGDPPPTVTGVGSAGSRSGSAGLGGWVGYRIWLDTPIPY